MQRTTTRTPFAARAVFALLMMVGTTLLNHSAMAETITYYHNDLLGSPVMATDQSGTILWREDYEPYGKRLRKEAGAASHAQWYTGKSHDDDTGLTYMGARYYDPRFGRFLAVDPVDFTQDNLHSFNRYAYANNNPYTFTDPDGNSPIDVIFFAADAVKLVAALNSGNPAAIQSASADLAASTVGLISPIPGTGQAIKAAKAADKINNARIAARSGGEVAKKKPVVIGENMKERVIPHAEATGGHYYKPRGEWTMAKNKRWAKDMKRQVDRGERKLVDIGPDPERKVPSEAYRKESKIFHRSEGD